MPSGASSQPIEPGLTRRGFLGAAAAGLAGLGAGLGISIARRRPKVEGEIVGASHRLGHRLREGGFPAPSSARARDIVIAGGGIAGLSAAWRLDKRGFHDFEVLELEAEPGGNARSGSSAATGFPWGAHYVPVPTHEAPAVRELFEELGVIEGARDGAPVYDERVLCAAPQERLFIHGRWQDGLFPHDAMTGEDAAEVDRFRDRMRALRALRDAEGRRAFTIPVDLSSEDPEIRALDRISMRAFMDREGFSSERLRWYVDYCCRDDYGCGIDSTSAWAGIHYYCGRGVEDPEVLTWPEGNGWIVRRLAERAGARITTGALVFRVSPLEGERGAFVDFMDARTGAVTRIRARHVIYALPRFTAPRVVEGYAPPLVSGFTYAPWWVANLHVERLPDETAWDNVIYGSRSLGYVVATHQSPRQYPGPSVLTYYRPLAELDPSEGRRALLARPWSRFRDEILADLEVAHPGIERIVRRIDVMLHGHAMIRPTPGFIWGAARRAAAEPFGAVLFAHSDMSGISIFEEAQHRGVAAAEEVLRRG